MIINIRGSSGSGKTTLVRRLMDELNAREIPGAKGKPVGYLLDGNIRVVGSYRTTCGGCDTIGTQDEICDRIREFSKYGHVIFEGLIINHLFSRYYALSQELGGIIWCFMDTSAEKCLENVKIRRLARGVDPAKPFNENRVAAEHQASVRNAGKFADVGERVIWLRYENSFEDLMALIRQEVPNGR